MTWANQTSHFTYGKTEARRCSCLVQGHSARRWSELGSAPTAVCLQSLYSCHSYSISGKAIVVAQMPSPASLDGPAKTSPALMKAKYILCQPEIGFPGLESPACIPDFQVQIRHCVAQQIRTQDLASNPSSTNFHLNLFHASTFLPLK